MNYYPHVVLPAVPPPPPEESPPPSPPSQPKQIDPVLDTPEEIQKWILSRKRNFPSKHKIQSKKDTDTRREERGDLSKFEIRMRKRLAIVRKAHKKEDDKKGKNPFLKYMNLNRKLTNNQILAEQRIVLQCIRYLVKHNFLEDN